MKSINLKVLIIAFLIISLLTFASFIGTMANDEGNSSGSFFFVHMFDVFRFPTHTLMWNIFKSSPIFFWGLVINILRLRKNKL